VARDVEAQLAACPLVARAMPGFRKVSAGGETGPWWKKGGSRTLMAAAIGPPPGRRPGRWRSSWGRPGRARCSRPMFTDEPSHRDQLHGHRVRRRRPC